MRNDLSTPRQPLAGRASRARSCAPRTSRRRSTAGRRAGASADAAAVPRTYAALLRHFADQPGDLTAGLPARQTATACDLLASSTAQRLALTRAQRAAVRTRRARRRRHARASTPTPDGVPATACSPSGGRPAATPCSSPTRWPRRNSTLVGAAADPRSILTLGGIALAALLGWFVGPHRARPRAPPDRGRAPRRRRPRTSASASTSAAATSSAASPASFNSMLAVLEETVAQLDESARAAAPARRRRLARAAHAGDEPAHEHRGARAGRRAAAGRARAPDRRRRRAARGALRADQRPDRARPRGRAHRARARTSASTSSSPRRSSARACTRPQARFEAELEPTLVSGVPVAAGPRRQQPARQRGQVRRHRRADRGPPARRRARGPRPRSRDRRRRPAPRLRPLLPRRALARAARAAASASRSSVRSPSCTRARSARGARAGRRHGRAHARARSKRWG